MIQEKLGLNGALKICKFWNNGALKNIYYILCKFEKQIFDEVFKSYSLQKYIWQ